MIEFRMGANNSTQAAHFAHSLSAHERVVSMRFGAHRSPFCSVSVKHVRVHDRNNCYCAHGEWNACDPNFRSHDHSLLCSTADREVAGSSSVREESIFCQNYLIDIVCNEM